MLAGQRLIEHRQELYDFKRGQEPDESFSDPTRSKNFDMADAFIMREAIENNRKQKEILKASQAAQAASDDVPTIDKAPE